MSYQERRKLGRSGLLVSRLGLAAGYGISSTAVEKAYAEYGINYFYWVSRKPGMKTALQRLAKQDRADLVIAVQSYDHLGLFLKRSVEGALRELATAYVDILFLGWFNRMPGSRLLDAARKLKDEGKVRHLGVSSHNRRFLGEMGRREGSPFDVLQVRYNAAHRGAESEVFEGLSSGGPGISAYTATRWGKLLKAKHMPSGEKPLTAAECYRFALTHPAVDICMAGPRTENQMVEGFQALAQGPLSEMEMARARSIGDHVHG